MLGADVGVNVGARIGKAVGALLGATLGDKVGGTLGTPVGILVGDMLGSRVGDSVGTALGSLLGAKLGLFVGGNDGFTVGICVGDVLVGTPVGAAVGNVAEWTIVTSGKFPALSRSDHDVEGQGYRTLKILKSESGTGAPIRLVGKMMVPVPDADVKDSTHTSP